MYELLRVGNFRAIDASAYGKTHGLFTGVHRSSVILTSVHLPSNSNLLRVDLPPLLGGLHREVTQRRAPVCRQRDMTFHRVSRGVELITPAGVNMLILNRGNANGRRVTRGVRAVDGQTNGPFITISYNLLSGRLTTSTLFKRRGKTFANTSAGQGKC